MRSVTRYDQTTAPNHPAMINVKASGELRHEVFNNILPLIKVAVGSQGKCRLLIVVGVFDGWDGEPTDYARSFHPCLSKQSANRTRPTCVDEPAKYRSLRALCLGLLTKSLARPESRRLKKVGKHG